MSTDAELEADIMIRRATLRADLAALERTGIAKELDATRARSVERREIRDAALDDALDDLQALVRMLWAIGGYMTPEQQRTLRAAMARLVVHGRTVEA